MTEDGLISLVSAAQLLDVSVHRVRLLAVRGSLEEVEQPGPSAGRGLILVRRLDVEQLARDGWPGRRPKRASAEDAAAPGR
jgi:hypothetical protein